MCLKTSRKYLQLYFIIYLYIYFCNRDKNLTQHHMQGKGKKKNKKKTEMNRMTAALYNALIKYAQIRLHTLCNWLWTLSMRKNSTLSFFLFFPLFFNRAGSLGSLLRLYCFAIIYYKFKRQFFLFFFTEDYFLPPHYGFRGFKTRNGLLTGPLIHFPTQKCTKASGPGWRGPTLSTAETFSVRWWK